MTDLDALLYTPEHEWVLLDADTATFGITDHAAGQLGDVVFVDLPAEGAELAVGAVCGEVESTKSVGELFTPVAGRVVAVNAEVAADPSLVNADPFGAGWLVRVVLDGAAVSGLLDRAAYVALTDAAA